MRRAVERVVGILFAFRGERIMRTFTRGILNFLHNEDGPTAVEYAIILALNVVLCVVAITSMGTNANKVFGNVSNKLANSGS